jgi:hypothetical protein
LIYDNDWIISSRPFPLTTVQLQKLCAKKLKISSEETMNIAEKLYQSGYISYPRTETSKYGEGFDFKALITLQKDDPTWGAYATKYLFSTLTHSLTHSLSHLDSLSSMKCFVFVFVLFLFPHIFTLLFAHSLILSLSLSHSLILSFFHSRSLF